MKLPRPALFLALPLVAMTATVDGQTVVLQAGIEDNFALPSETASPSASVAALLGALDDFDETNINQNVVHTFEGLPCGIVAAELVFDVGGVSEAVDTDGVALGFADASSTTYASSVAWARHFGPSNAASTIFPSPDPGLQSVVWSSSSLERFTLDLDALPLAGGGTMSLIDALNQRGFLDVLTGDDSVTDFYTLTLTVVPSAGSVTYCSAGTSASGCQAQILAVGSASASASSGFVISTTNTEANKTGLFYWGAARKLTATAIGTSSSFACVLPPVKRSQLLSSGGTPGMCDGAFSLDLNARWTSQPAQGSPAGTTLFGQVWYRDPFNTSDQMTSRSDAIEFCVAP